MFQRRKPPREPGASVRAIERVSDLARRRGGKEKEGDLGRKEGPMPLLGVGSKKKKKTSTLFVCWGRVFVFLNMGVLGFNAPRGGSVFRKLCSTPFVFPLLDT